MNKFKVFLNVICVIVAAVSTLTVISLAEPDVSDNADNTTASSEVTTEAPSFEEETTTKSDEETTTKFNEETTKKSNTTTTEEQTTEAEITEETTKKTEKTNRTYDEDYEYDYGEDEGGTKSTRSSLETTKTTTRKKVEKNINDYGKRYRWLKWTCYFLVVGSIITLIAVNVNYAKQNTQNKVGSKKRKSSHKDDIRRR